MNYSLNEFIMLFNDLFWEKYWMILVRGGEEFEYLLVNIEYGFV